MIFYFQGGAMDIFLTISRPYLRGDKRSHHDIFLRAFSLSIITRQRGSYWTSSELAINIKMKPSHLLTHLPWDPTTCINSKKGQRINNLKKQIKTSKKKLRFPVGLTLTTDLSLEAFQHSKPHYTKPITWLAQELEQSNNWHKMGKGTVKHANMPTKKC